MKRGLVIVGYLDDGQWSACFGLSYRDLLMQDSFDPARAHVMREGGMELRKLCGTGGIPDGRNEIAERFLDSTEGEWLFMVDSDMGFPADTVARLVASADPYQRPVMGGLCFAQKRTGITSPDTRAETYEVIPTLYEYAELDDEVGFRPFSTYEKDAVVQVSGTGAACLLIHRTVLHRIRESHGPVWFDPVVHATGNRGKPRRFSEDLSFCVRVQGEGFKVFVDTGVKTCHEKGGVFLTEEMYDWQERAKKLDAAESTV